MHSGAHLEECMYVPLKFNRETFVLRTLCSVPICKIFNVQRVVPECDYGDIIVMTLQSGAHPTKYLTGYASDNSVSGNVRLTYPLVV